MRTVSADRVRARSWLLAAGALTVTLAGTARADEVREKALEDRVLELERQLEQVLTEIRDGGVNRSDDEMEMRVGALEKFIKLDEDGAPPYWKGGWKLDSRDGAFKLQLGGRIQVDASWFDNGDRDEFRDAGFASTNTAVYFRRSRLNMQGTLYKNVMFKAEYDFEGGAPNWADVYIALDPQCGPVSEFRVGHFDEFMGLDRLTSSTRMTFIERSTIESFVPQRNTGIAALGRALNDRLQWQAGIFRDANAFGNDTGNANQDEYNYTARIAGRPWVSEDAKSWMHLGLSASQRTASNEMATIAVRPELRQTPSYATTGVMPVCDEFRVGLEAAANFGPFHAQAEWVNISPEFDRDANLSDSDFQTWSVQAGYFLTGENREWDSKVGRWDRVKVKRVFGDEGGPGAWEIALRHSEVDLDDGDINGGKLSDWTLGLNWYLNPHTRIMLNLVRSDIERDDLDLDATLDAVVVRFAIDW